MEHWRKIYNPVSGCTDENVYRVATRTLEIYSNIIWENIVSPNDRRNPYPVVIVVVGSPSVRSIRFTFCAFRCYCNTLYCTSLLDVITSVVQRHTLLVTASFSSRPYTHIYSRERRLQKHRVFIVVLASPIVTSLFVSSLLQRYIVQRILYTVSKLRVPCRVKLSKPGFSPKLF